MGLQTVAEAVEVISTARVRRGERFFVGVVLHGPRRARALRRLDDGAAEAAAWSSAGLPKTHGSKRTV